MSKTLYKKTKLFTSYNIYKIKIKTQPKLRLAYK